MVCVSAVEKDLQPFANAQKLLEGDRYVTNSLVPGLVGSIRKTLLLNCEEDSRIASSVSKEMLKLASGNSSLHHISEHQENAERTALSNLWKRRKRYKQRFYHRGYHWDI